MYINKGSADFYKKWWYEFWLLVRLSVLVIIVFCINEKKNYITAINLSISEILYFFNTLDKLWLKNIFAIVFNKILSYCLKYRNTFVNKIFCTLNDKKVLKIVSPLTCTRKNFRLSNCKPLGYSFTSCPVHC